MKKRNLIFIVLTCFVFSFLYSFSQERTDSDPLLPAKSISRFKIGILSGVNYPVAPAELTKNPVNSTSKIQKSLLNGFDGLGFKSTYDLGILLRYRFAKYLNLGADLSFTGWKSDITCNCTDKSWKSSNSLSSTSFALLLQYYIYDRIFVSPELNLNVFSVHSTEDDTTRGTLDFSKNYLRAGAGIALGYEFPVFKKVAIDVFAKARIPNLIVLQPSTTSFTDLQPLISSGNSTSEATIVYLSLNLGIAFSMSFLY